MPDITENLKQWEFSNRSVKDDVFNFLEAQKKDFELEEIVNATKTIEFSSELMKKINPNMFNKIRSVDLKGEDCLSKVDASVWNRYTIRHYTQKNPSSFNGEIKSYLTMFAEGVLLDRSYDLNQSGHTTAQDWDRIGNVGDTFYSLFFDGESATGIVPAFIKKAKYYVEWTLDEFSGECWASSDWLGLQDPKAVYVGCSAGNIKKLIASSLCVGNEFVPVGSWMKVRLENPTAYLKGFTNFEIKKHGSFRFSQEMIKEIEK